jgi:hypothetical protein
MNCNNISCLGLTKTVTLASYIVNKLGFITEVKSDNRGVRTESFYNTDTFRP